MRIPQDSPLLEQVRLVLDQLNSTSNVLLIHDTDPDGLCSAILMEALLNKKEVRKIIFKSGSRNDFASIATPELLEQEKISHIITTDLQTDGHKEQVTQVSKKIPILIIDHHAVINEKLDPNVVVFKPQIIDHTINAARYSTSLMVYDINTQELSDLRWLMLIGFIADFGYYENQEVLHEIYESYGWELPSSPDEAYSSYCGLGAKYLNSTLIIGEDKVPSAFYDLKTSEAIGDFLSSSTCELGKSISEQTAQLVKDASINAEWIGNVLWYEIDSPFNFKKPVSGSLGKKYWEKVVFCVTVFDDKAKFSVRCNSGAVPLNDILRATAKIFGGHAGGHPVASGGFVPATKLAKFKKAIVPLLNDHLNAN